MAIKRNFSQKNELIYAIHHFSLNQDTREIFIQGFFDNETESSEIDYKNAAIFLKNIQYLIALDSTKPIVVHLFTVGGEWDAGMVIYDAIATCPVHVTTIVHGQAYSMGSIILQAADTRILMPNAHFMVHEGWTTICNTSKGAVSTMEYEKEVGETMINIYVNRCKDGEFFKDYKVPAVKKYIKGKMDRKQDWYLNAEDSVKYGFADGVLGAKPEYKDIYTILNKNGV